MLIYCPCEITCYQIQYNIDNIYVYRLRLRLNLFDPKYEKLQ